MQDSGSRRRLTLLTGQPEDSDAQGSTEAEDRGLADVQILQRRAAAQSDAIDEQGFYLETVSEYLWARDVAGLAPTTLENLVRRFWSCVPSTTWCRGGSPRGMWTGSTRARGAEPVRRYGAS